MKQHDFAEFLRAKFPWTRPVPVLRKPRSFGFGDRVGDAGVVHAALADEFEIAPILAQQSMRELELTRRTFQDVVDAATINAFIANYRRGFGADGDHLKTIPDILAAVKAGATMITIDVSELVDKTYSRAIDFCIAVQRALDEIAADVDLEISLDEGPVPTTPEEHRFVADKLLRGGVKFASIAPKFVGEFQKGIDYTGNVKDFESNFRDHVRVAESFGGYKISVHSGSDKFSIFPIVSRVSRGHFHVKTAGTSWLEAVHAIEVSEPALYERIRKRAHVEAPKIAPLYHLELDALTERQILHIAYGAILRAKKSAFRDALEAHTETYHELLRNHFIKHLTLLDVPRRK